MSLFGKKKFGLKEASVVVEVKPNITADGAKTGAAFVEALGLSVTVVAEAEAKIGELETSVAEMQEGVKAAGEGLKEAEVKAATVIGNLKAEVKATVEAIKRVVSKKVEEIEKARDMKIGRLEDKITKVENTADDKACAVRFNSRARSDKATDEMSKKIAEAEAQLKSDLADLKDRISSLESETKSAKAEISTLAKIKSLFV